MFYEKKLSLNFFQNYLNLNNILYIKNLETTLLSNTLFLNLFSKFFLTLDSKDNSLKERES
jgi:hypothetical protein